MIRPLEQVHAEMADEHRRIMDLVSRIESESNLSVLPAMLRELHDLLVNHFAHEQFPGGLYESMGAHGPDYHEDLKVLVREHCTVLSTARALVERARAVDLQGGAKLLGEVADLLQMLRDHEVREHRLVEKLKAASAAAG